MSETLAPRYLVLTSETNVPVIPVRDDDHWDKVLGNLYENGFIIAWYSKDRPGAEYTPDRVAPNGSTVGPEEVMRGMGNFLADEREQPRAVIIAFDPTDLVHMVLLEVYKADIDALPEDYS